MFRNQQGRLKLGADAQDGRGAGLGAAPVRGYRRRLGVEALEARRMLSIVPTLLKDIGSGDSSNPTNFVEAGTTIYFTADDGILGKELWKTDGTSVGTVLVKDIGPGASGSSLSSLTNVNGTLFFQANDGTNGSELWKSNGTSVGTVLVKDIRPGASGSAPSSLTNVNGTLFFGSNDGMFGFELWKSDGTSVGTVLVKDIFPGSFNSYLNSLTNVNGKLLFQAWDGTNGSELWTSDGTSVGTVLVKDIRSGSYSSYLNSLTNVNGTLFFTADDGTNGYELWTSDGTSVGTVLVMDINPGAYSSSASSLTNVNGTLFFGADDGVHGTEPWWVLPPPSLSLSPATVTQAEGDAGTTDYVFTVTLSAVSGQTATVVYNTADGTATLADNDYQAANGVLTFLPGETVKQVTVLVNGDTTNEANEDFMLALSSPTNAPLSASAAMGTIQNDDSSVAGRHLFYNESGTSTRYDGNNLAINSFDDLAIASDKTAYLWEDAGAATFANVSSYTKGINGIMVDIAGGHGTITAADFIFRVGNNNSPGLWAAANAPTSISVRAGAGVGGSDRVTIIWNGAAAPIKQWLNVIVLATANTGMAQKVGYPAGHGDQFFFGNAVGNVGTGDTVANSLVSAIDESAIRANPALISANIPITNLYDVGRNASVSALDESAARLNGTNPTTTLKYLNLTSAPAAPEADGGDEISPLVATSDSGDSGVASALTASATTSSEISVPKWISNRIDSIDLNSGAPARLFHYLHDANTPRSRALLQKFDSIADSLGLDDELLDALVADLT